MKSIPKPKKSDYAEYYGTYVSKVTERHIYALLRKNAYAIPAFLFELPDDKWHYRYADGKWSLAEVVMHMIDSERVFAYRALRIARGDTMPLPGFDQNLFAENCNVSSRKKYDVLEEYYLTRKATLMIMDGLDDAAVERKGTMSDSEVTVAALFYIIGGHELHHMDIIRARYLP